METAYMENITVIIVPNTGAVFVGRSYTCWLSVVILSIETVQTCVLICVCVILTILTHKFCNTCALSPKFHVIFWQDVLNIMLKSE